MSYIHTILVLFIVVVFGGLYNVSESDTHDLIYIKSKPSVDETPSEIGNEVNEVPPVTFIETGPIETAPVPETETVPMTLTESDHRSPTTPVGSTLSKFDVPFYSQFADISDPGWKKIGCGIASLAMLIELYEPGTVSVDTLLQEGIAAGAYLNNVGWTYAGLIGVSKKYGLGGASYDLGSSNMETAFTHLQDALEDGPVMVSVHYTFDPKNPIPHLVIANGVRDGMLYYNDPAEKSGGGSVSVNQFQSAWKKRYIEIRPTT